MGAMSDYLENKLIDWLFRGGAFTPPAGLYFALFTAAPTDAGGGTEVAGGGYARASLAPSASNWQDTSGGTAATSTGTSGTTKNAVQVNFPTATANWGTVTHVALFDAATGGNMLDWGALTTPQAINSGGTYDFPAGQFSYQIDN